MAGYNGFSKSNNALEAEARGLMVATDMAAHLRAEGLVPGCTAADVATGMPAREWHHASKHYLPVDYYDAEDLEDEDEGAVIVARIRAAAEDRKARAKKDAVVIEGAEVTWLEWSGTRNHPHATERSACGARVEYKPGGKFCRITLPGGSSFRKGIETRGFEIDGLDPARALRR